MLVNPRHVVEGISVVQTTEISFWALVERLSFVPNENEPQPELPRNMRKVEKERLMNEYKARKAERKGKRDSLVKKLSKAAKAESFGEKRFDHVGGSWYHEHEVYYRWVPLAQVWDWLLSHLKDEPEALAEVTHYDFDGLLAKIRLSWAQRVQEALTWHNQQLAPLLDKKRKLEQLLEEAKDSAAPPAKRARPSDE